MSRVEFERSETLARLEILVDRVHQLGLAAGLQCRRALTGGALPLRVAEFHYPQGCANPAAPHDTPTPATPTHAHFVQSSFDLEASAFALLVFAFAFTPLPLL